MATKSAKKSDAQRNLEFLVEMKDRLAKGRNGDPTQFEHLALMIDDWIHELEYPAPVKPEKRG